MFDITPNDISKLNDVDLRELVGRLCEAELVSNGLSAAAVTWGGSQTAADGGLDVRVELPAGERSNGFIPRPLTGFQVKTPDMPRAAILKEMRPQGELRAAIKSLVDGAGAYVIVSSRASAADTALQNRRQALREGLAAVENAVNLHTDFYDRQRLASWIRQHPGLIAWVREKIGRSLVGWRPYGPWSGASEGTESEYLIDTKLRLSSSIKRETDGQSIVDGINELRDELTNPGRVVRLVGLSGVGKTRLAQALFDPRIGIRPLDQAAAIYSNLSDDPSPQPVGLASDLIAKGLRAIVIVDNCPPDLHGRLSEVCRSPNSSISVLTIEYDVRDDQPEGTHVFSLDTSSPELIEMLVRRRYPEISPISARVIANASGGNARIAIALAATVESSETITNLSDEDLFQRLFRQRQDPDHALLLAAQTCSLLYSFRAESSEDEDSEIPSIAILAGQNPAETYRHVSELMRRDLVQPRGPWRAVLPHALANKLAAKALEDIPYEIIHKEFIEKGTPRLARSFSRRIAFLYDHPVAKSIVAGWLSPNGLLGNLPCLNDLGHTMFKNVAPVSPECALFAFEGLLTSQEKFADFSWRGYLSMIRSIAYDPVLFERCVNVLTEVLLRGSSEKQRKEAAEILSSFFTMHFSGTHATIDQRLVVAERFLRSTDVRLSNVGLIAIKKILSFQDSWSSQQFGFGARPRDFGYQPRAISEVERWYELGLGLVRRSALKEGTLQLELRDVVSRIFRRLWVSGHARNDLEALVRDFARGGFWQEGWTACRQALYRSANNLSSEEVSRLSELEAFLKPSNLMERALAAILAHESYGGEQEGGRAEVGGRISFEKRQEIAQNFGVTVVQDKNVFLEILPSLFGTGDAIEAFGRGLASGAHDRLPVWNALVAKFAEIPPGSKRSQVLLGFLLQLRIEGDELFQSLLDAALAQDALLSVFPLLQSSVGIDKRGADRLKNSLIGDSSPIDTYRQLAYGRVVGDRAGADLRDLVVLIADKPGGFDVAVEILYMRFFGDQTEKRPHDRELIDAGQELLRRIALFSTFGDEENYRITSLIKTCIAEASAAEVAVTVASRLKTAIKNNQTYFSTNVGLVSALLECHPLKVLDALFSDLDNGDRADSILDDMEDRRGSPADVVPSDVLIAWCNGESDLRYVFAASFITFFHLSDSDSPVWSEQAKELLIAAPNKKDVLQEFIRRFTPMNWSGSRAAIIEVRAKLLETVHTYIPSELAQFVADSQHQISEEIRDRRAQETREDRSSDERFE